MQCLLAYKSKHTAQCPRKHNHHCKDHGKTRCTKIQSIMWKYFWLISIMYLKIWSCISTIEYHYDLFGLTLFSFSFQQFVGVCFKVHRIWCHTTTQTLQTCCQKAGGGGKMTCLCLPTWSCLFGSRYRKTSCHIDIIWRNNVVVVSHIHFANWGNFISCKIYFYIWWK